MADQRRDAIQVERHGVGQEGSTAGCRKLVRYQKIPIAMHEEQPSAARCQDVQGVGNLRVEWIVKIIVAGPIFKQVAEYVQRICAGSNVPDKAQEQLCAARMPGAEVQIRNEQGVQLGNRIACFDEVD